MSDTHWTARKSPSEVYDVDHGALPNQIVSGNVLIAALYVDDLGDPVASLIAAAPDLYEALENLLKVHEGEGGTKYHAGDIARAALDRAKGKA